MAAVEFALIAPVFFAILFSIFEAGLIMVKISLTDNAVAEVGREIYTGAVQGDVTITAESLKQSICGRIVLIKNCTDNITLEVRTIASFNDIPQDGEVCRDALSGGIAPTVTYAPGVGSEISFMRVCVTTGINTPLLGLGLALPKNANGRYEIVSSLAFANEPF